MPRNIDPYDSAYREMEDYFNANMEAARQGTIEDWLDQMQDAGLKRQDIEDMVRDVESRNAYNDGESHRYVSPQYEDSESQRRRRDSMGRFTGDDRSYDYRSYENMR